MRTNSIYNNKSPKNLNDINKTSPNDIKIIFSDYVARLLLVNMILVLVGYSATLQFGTQILVFFKIIKFSIIFISFIFVIYKNGLSTAALLNNNSIYLIILFIIIYSLFTKEYYNFYRGLTFSFPFLYIVYTINYLLKYGAFNLLISLSFMILLTYLLVPISFLFGETNFDSSALYGYTEGNFFYSNHFGWASSIFILSSITTLRYYPLNSFFKLLIYSALPFTFYLLIISASRSAMLSLIISFVFLLLRDRSIGLVSKFLILIIPFFIILFISSNENSALDYLQQKNDRQIESGVEGRILSAATMIEYLNEEPTEWITGIGMFNYEVIQESDGYTFNYHNSYLEILFGIGVIMMALFLLLMVIRPIQTFLLKTHSISYLIFPLMIIPFFESNLTSGQFLFFPWFSYMLLLNAKGFYIKDYQ